MDAAIEKVLTQAKHDCEQSGLRFTTKRKNILAVMLKEDKPLSAYDIVERYKDIFGESIPAMSAYRMLDFLVSANLAHKLETTNQYLPCSHIACDHAHEVPQFLICDKCHGVTEIGIRKDLMESLNSSVSNVGFKLNGPQLELHGVCSNCQ